MKEEVLAPPMSFERFLSLYLGHLGAADRPTCFIAYCRAESDAVEESGARRYKNFNTFRATMSRHFAQKRDSN